MSENEKTKENEQKEEVPKEKSPIPNIENYIIPIDIEKLKLIQPAIEFIIKNDEKKFEKTKGTNIILKHKEIQPNLPEISSLFTEKNSLSEIKDTEKYSVIFDCLHFYHFIKDKSETITKGVIDTNILDKLYNNFLAEKGTLIMLGDYQYLCQLCEGFKKILGKNMTKFFIKFYTIDTIPLMGLFSIQKMAQSKEEVKIENEKMLSYELNKTNEQFSFSKPISYQLGQFKRAITYFYEMYQYHVYLNQLHPGTITPIKIKENIWSDNIDYTFTICDAKDEDLIKLNKCAAIIINKSFANEFITLTAEGNMSLCKQCQVSRLLLIRPAPFNFDPINVIKQKLNNYILLFKFTTCVDEAIPIMRMGEESNNYKNIFVDSDIIVRDVQEKDMNFRQLIFTSNPYQIQCEVKIGLKSKTKLKSEKDKILTIKTAENYEQKNLVQFFDDSFISMFYIQALLSCIFFLDLKNISQKEKVKILVLGAGIGTINYYCNKMLKGKVAIDAVELSEKVAQIGMEYFGLNNYKKETNPNIKWYFKDAKEYIKERNVKEYYDLIIMDINNTKSIEGISPPPVFFEEKILSKIHELLKPNGIYIIDLLARSYKNFKMAYDAINSKFAHILYVDNNEDLNKIHVCFKTKKTKIEYLELYSQGLKLLSNPEEGDIKDIEPSARQFINKFVEASREKEILEAYTSL